MRCSRCGKLGATAQPNWIERADKLPGGTLAMTAPRLSAEQRRGLETLASDRHGLNEELLVLGPGFSQA
jgi:hypothetical protein